MAKQLVHKYSFDASTRTVVIPEIINVERLLTITNVTANEIIYVFSDPDRGATSYTIDTAAKTTTIVLAHNTTTQGVYANPAQSGYTGSGTSAEFSVARANGSYSVTISAAGSGYVQNETITIVGTALGGATTANDATITISSVDGNGAVPGATVTGTAIIDTLQIFQEKDSVSMRPDKTYTDPVSKFRVSQPENLIDTDFEYGKMGNVRTN